MDKLIEVLINFNLPTVVTVVAAIWYFTRDIKKDVKEINEELHRMNTRVSRMEGTVYGKDIYEKIKE